MNRDDNFDFSLNREKAISLALPPMNTAGEEKIVLSADIGGTKTHVAIYRVQENSFEAVEVKSFLTKDYKSFYEMYSFFVPKEIPKIDAISLGVAGPVVNGEVDATNFPWHLEIGRISRETGVDAIALINDLEANAYGLAALEKKDFAVIAQGADVKGNAAIISPGTGLGEAGLFWDGQFLHPFATEGGHCDFSPRTERDLRLWQFLHKKYHHVSWERLISGPGIYDIYLFLLEHHELDKPEWMENFYNKTDPAIIISQQAAEGDHLSNECLDLFIRFLAVEAAQLALKLKAVGGIYIGGGIIPKIINSLEREKFLKEFINSGRMDPLLKKMKINVILNSKTAIYGAALYGAGIIAGKPV